MKHKFEVTGTSIGDLKIKDNQNYNKVFNNRKQLTEKGEVFTV